MSNAKYSLVTLYQFNYGKEYAMSNVWQSRSFAHPGQLGRSFSCSSFR